MDKIRKVPMRKCVITNERFPKKELMRVVRTPEGKVVFDKTGKANGRGVYLSKSKTVIEKAKKNKVLSRQLNTEIPNEIYLELIEAIDDEN